jgi:hypothetical protein
LPDGSVLTESAAILIHLGLTFPESNLLPDNPADRDQAIRGLAYIVSNCYAAIGIIDYPERWLAEADESSRQNLMAPVHGCIGVGRCLPISFPASCIWETRHRERWMCWRRWSVDGQAAGNICARPGRGFTPG